jgi:hypothetical protein
MSSLVEHKRRRIIPRRPKDDDEVVDEENDSVVSTEVGEILAHVDKLMDKKTTLLFQ